MTDTLVLLPGEVHRLDAQRTIEVEEIVEKHLESGSGMMRVRLRLHSAQGSQTLEFTSLDPARRWQGLLITYVGGWRSEVRLEIRPIPP